MLEPRHDATRFRGFSGEAAFPELPPRDESEVGWSVPWSDLMMVMFILFVVLFATRVAEREAGAVFRPNASDASASLGSAWIPWRSPGERLATAPASLPGVDVAVASDDSIRLRLPSALLFERGSVEIGAEAGDVLDGVASVLTDAVGPIHVIGHTDDDPVESEAFPTNWELAPARAAAVARALIVRGVLDPGRVTVMGRGKHEPVAPNVSEEAKARNRRVEILIPAPRLLRAVP